MPGLIFESVRSLPGVSDNQVAPVPLPAALWLFASGLAALTPTLRRRAQRKSSFNSFNKCPAP
jgi:hypothetical protein